MRSKIQPIPLVVILLGLVGCSHPTASPAPPAARSVAFSGVLLDVSTGSPVPLLGAAVAVNPVGRVIPEAVSRDDPPPEDYRLAVTDETGEFRFDVAPDRYEVLVYYQDMGWRRVIDVRNPTVMTQSVDVRWHGSVEMIECSSDSTCGTPEQYEAMLERRRQEESQRLQREAEARRAAEAAAEVERLRAVEQEKAENIEGRASPR